MLSCHIAAGMMIRNAAAPLARPAQFPVTITTRADAMASPDPELSHLDPISAMDADTATGPASTSLERPAERIGRLLIFRHHGWAPGSGCGFGAHLRENRVAPTRPI